MITPHGKMNSSWMLYYFLIICLLITSVSIAFTSWVDDETSFSSQAKNQNKTELIAEYGARETALNYLQTHKPGKVKSTKRFKGGDVFIQDTETRKIGFYEDVTISPVNDFKDNLAYINQYYYDITSTGSSINPDWNSPENGTDELNDDSNSSIRMRVKIRTFSDYLYLTDNEQTVFGEVIWFCDQDVFDGRVHSNSQIGIWGDPTFYGPLSTTASEFYEYQANPYFEFPPLFNAPEVPIPNTANSLRQAAINFGNYIDDNEGQYWTRLRCNSGIWECRQWPAGTPFDSLQIEYPHTITMSGGINIVFVEGELYLWGNDVIGQTHIASSGNMWLCDDITISGFAEDSRTAIPLEIPSILGLTSEKNVIIKNSYPNGRNNSSGDPHYQDNSNITITAAIVALGGSFTFEHHNDPWDNYIHSVGHAGPDERGDIILRGSLVQRRRGYLHRWNSGGTGYGKDFRYDQRLVETPPPYSMYATDNDGNAIVDIVKIDLIK